MKYPAKNIFVKEQQRLKIFPFFLFTPTPPPQCSFGVNQELIEHHKSPGAKIFNKWRKWDDEKHPHPVLYGSLPVN